MKHLNPRHRRVAAAFVLVVATGLGACSSDSAQTSDTTTTTSAVVSTTTTAEYESTSGWGADGSGVASVKLYDAVTASIEPRVFRRARTESANGIGVLNTRDVFLTWQVALTQTGRTTAKIVVAGLDTSGDDASLYPMKVVGGDGVVEVMLQEKDDAWEPQAMAWTVVSRTILAVLFRATSAGDHLGLVEYYDLSTGEPAAEIGDGGRTLIPRDFAMDRIEDFAFRAINDDATPRFVIIGPAVGDGDPQARFVVAGFTPNGRPDTGVGGREGWFSLPARTDTDDAAVIEVALADPGLADTDGRLGVVVAEQHNNDSGEVSTSVLRGLIAAIDPVSGVLSMEAPRAVAESVDLGITNVAVGNVAFSGPGELTAHVTTRETDEFAETTATELKVTVAARSQAIAPAVSPRWNPTGSLDVIGDRIVNVSPEGKDFHAITLRDPSSNKTFARVCFGTIECLYPRNLLVIELSDVASNEDTWTSVENMAVDSGGVHVVLRDDRGTSRPPRYSLASLDGAGTKGVAVVELDEQFGTHAETAKTDDEMQEAQYVIEAPIVLGAGSVYAPRYDRLKGVSVRTQKTGSPAVDRKLSLPLGIRSLSAAAWGFARVGAQATTSVARVFSDTGEERRLYRSNVVNGSIETDFGAEGYVVLPRVQFDNDGCGDAESMVGHAGVVANLHLDWDPTATSDDETCSPHPVEVSWTAFSAGGETIGAGTVRADLRVIDGDEVVGAIVDTAGNLYVARSFATRDEDGTQRGRGFRVGRFTNSGVLDTSFGVEGLVEIAGSRFGWRGAIALDDEGRVYLATTSQDEQGNTSLVVVRHTTEGRLDAAGSMSPSGVVATAPENVGATIRGNVDVPVRDRIAEQRSRLAGERRRKESLAASLPADIGVTVATEKPVLTSVRAVLDRSLTVTWASSAAVGRTYVTATASPGGRSCTANDGTCVIRGLDPTEIYSVTVATTRGEAVAPLPSDVAPVKPIVSLKVGRLASPTTFVRPASRGKATWRVRGGCTLNESRTRLTAPKTPTTCVLSVTTAKFASTPKTTKSVTIAVTK